MQFDDRLATVLQHRADGERMARVQFRQLIDLLGEPTAVADEALERAAFRRLEALTRSIPREHLAAIIVEAGQRLRNPRLVAWLAGTDLVVGTTAVTHASLTSAQWRELVPALSAEARAALRDRASSGASPGDSLVAALDRADEQGGDDSRGRDDEVSTPMPTVALSKASCAAPDASGTTDLGALVRRIEAFQQARKARQDALPAQDEAAGSAPALVAVATEAEPATAGFVFTTDPAGHFDWIENAEAAPLVGQAAGSLEGASEASLARTLRQRRPAVGVAVELGLAGALEGTWVLDAAPRFDRRSGTYTGYVGRMRRPAAPPVDAGKVEGAARIRQMLLELRNPVTAIQGFAEMIQQQTVGPVPHEYRALAASIAGDAARMLAGFSEIERLARLEAGQGEFEQGASDFAHVVRRQIAQLQTVLSPRVARIDCLASADELAVAMTSHEAETLAWRVLGTLAAATAAGETLRLDLGIRQGRARLAAYLPSAMAQVGDVFAGEVRPVAGQAIATGLFGSGFALRLARAEARAAGGDLVRHDEDRLVLTLPLAQFAGTADGDDIHDAERADV